MGTILASKLSLPQQENLIKKLRDLIFEKMAPLSPIRVLLFGSATKREMTEASDLDVVVIIASPSEVKSTQKTLNQLSRLMEWPVDCLVIDEVYFQKRAAIGGVYAVAQGEGEELS